MEGKFSAICSKYIIDGVRYQVSPKEMLDAAKTGESCPSEGWDPIVDETVDSCPVSSEFSRSAVNQYLAAILADNSRPEVPIRFAEEFTRWTVAKALIDSLWCNGNFRLEDLTLQLSWQWNTGKIGNMAAFYKSVSGLVEYLDDLGVYIDDYQFSEGKKCRLMAKAILEETSETKEELNLTPTVDQDLETIGEQTSFQSGSCSLWEETPLKPRKVSKSCRRKCANTVTGSESSWIIYLPFDTCPYRLGGSRLCQVMDKPTAIGPEIGDADYFIDCYEVVREMVEDGVIVAGRTIREGGLLPALKNFVGTDKGMDADISGIMRAYEEQDIVPILFGEVPGVLVEVADIDYDYVDAEFLLQDVAYYPLGHLNRRKKSISVIVGESSSIVGILQSLMNSQEASEGED